jgi:hypothetical protein
LVSRDGFNGVVTKLFKLRAKPPQCKKAKYYKVLAIRPGFAADLIRIQNLRFAYLLCAAQ